MPLLPPPGQLGHEVPGIAGEDPGVGTEALEEEREALVAVRRLLDEELALAALVGQPQGVGDADEEPAQPLGEVASDHEQVLLAQLGEQPLHGLGRVDL